METTQETHSCVHELTDMDEGGEWAHCNKCNHDIHIRTGLSEHTYELLNQLNTMHSYWRGEFGITNILIVDEHCLRFIVRGLRKFTIEIRYDHGQDLYDVKAWQLVPTWHETPIGRVSIPEAKEVYNQTGLFFDQLIEAMRKATEE